MTTVSGPSAPSAISSLMRGRATAQPARPACVSLEQARQGRVAGVFLLGRPVATVTGLSPAGELLAIRDPRTAAVPPSAGARSRTFRTRGPAASYGGRHAVMTSKRPNVPVAHHAVGHEARPRARQGRVRGRGRPPRCATRPRASGTRSTPATLTVFEETYSRSPISRNDRCVDSSGSSRSSAAVSDDAPVGAAPILASLGPQLAGLHRRGRRGPAAAAGCRRPAAAPLAAPAGSASADVGARQLEQCLDRHDRQGVGEQGPEPGGAPEVVTGLGDVPLVQRGPGGPRVDEGAGPVVVETPVLHDASPRARASAVTSAQSPRSAATLHCSARMRAASGSAPARVASFDRAGQDPARLGVGSPCSR